MNTVDKYFLFQGDKIKKIIDSFFLNDTSDILDYAFNIQDIEDYLLNKSNLIRKNILNLIKNRKKYVFAETGEMFEITSDFLEYELKFIGNLTQFQRYLKKASLKELKEFERVFFYGNFIIEK